MALPASDSFTAAADAALQTYSANWTIGNGGFNVNAAGDYAYTNATNDNAAYWNADTFGSDQYAEAKLVGNVTYYSQIGVAVRCAAGGNHYGLYFQSGGQHIWLYKLVSGTWTELAHAQGVGAWHNGDTIRLEVSGTTLTPKHNGALITALGTVSDSSLSSGAAGICGYGIDAAARLDDWQGGNLGGGGVSMTPAAAAAAAGAVAPAVVRGAVTVAPAFAPAAASASFVLLCGATTGGVLAVDPTNGRYFRNDAGPVLLAGFHTWASIQDSWPTQPIQPLDFDEYLGALVTHGCNFTKAWFLESARNWGDSAQYFAPHPWPRTGPGNAADGLPKFDLIQFDAGYFARLRERIIRLGNEGIYVCVQLFQGWHVALKAGSYDPWAYHPFAAANNINSIDGDTNDDGAGYETRSTAFTAVYNLQKAYVSKVIDTLNDLDNVFYEIANEEATGSLSWQRALVDYVRSYEAGKPKQHPVGMTVCWPGGDNADLYASDVEWLSPNGDYTPDAASDAKISAFDTDHITGLTAEYKWVWRSVCQGHNPWYMDEWAGETYSADRRNNATYQRIRANLGRVVEYAGRLDLSAATPQGGLSSTGYCLAQTTGGARLLAYQDGSGAFTVNLSGLAGVFAVEWLRTAATTPSTQSGGTVAGGATRTLTPPWAGEDAVALLELVGAGVTPTAAVSAAGAVAPAVVRGAVALAPGAAGAVALAVAPVVVLGMVTVVPDAAVSAAGAVAPTVQQGTPVLVAPGFAAAVVAAVAPAVALGVIALVPDTAASGAEAGGAVVVLGAVTAVPAPAGAAAGAQLGTVQEGAAVTVAPDAAASVSGAGAPVVMLGSVTVTPAPAMAAAGAAGPGVLVGLILAAVTLRSQRSLVLVGNRVLVFQYRR